MTTVIYAGSFDPFTYGHLDIVKSGSEIFEKLVIGVTYNIDKKGFIPIEDRVELIKEAVKSIPNVEVTSFNGLTVDFAKEKNASVLLRGLRNTTDFEYEKELAQVNEKLAGNIKTVFLMTKPEHSFVSSSAVRELYAYKSDLSEFVPKNIRKYLLEKES